MLLRGSVEENPEHKQRLSKELYLCASDWFHLNPVSPLRGLISAFYGNLMFKGGAFGDKADFSTIMLFFFFPSVDSQEGF